MTDKLPPHIIKLFTPRPPLSYLPPLDKAPEKRMGAIVTGVAAFVLELGNYDSNYLPWKTTQEKHKEKVELEKMKAANRLAEGLEKYDPTKDNKILGNPFHTLFLFHLSYQLTEEDLSQEFGVYGPIKHLRLVKSKDGQERGYAFIEYEKEKDMKAAYKDADGLKLFGRRIRVDVERGRTVKHWKPRRLGGGLGNARSNLDNSSNRHDLGKKRSQSDNERYYYDERKRSKRYP